MQSLPNKALSNLEPYAELIDWLSPQGYNFFKAMPDGSLCALHKFIFTYGLCTHIDWHTSYKYRWCYEREADAILALSRYEGEGDPIGPWLKYKGVGPERHNPLMYEKDKNGLWQRIANQALDICKIWPRGIP